MDRIYSVFVNGSGIGTDYTTREQAFRVAYEHYQENKHDEDVTLSSYDFTDDSYSEAMAQELTFRFRAYLFAIND